MQSVLFCNVLASDEAGTVMTVMVVMVVMITTVIMAMVFWC